LTPINLSYLIATRNRLPFLKITLQKLMAELQPDEEIVVVDGNSSDGSKEFLQQLFEEKKIHRFISEPDKNQAHAWNKALLMATGTIVKKIIDDDVFCYSAIRACKGYMLENPKTDVVISDDLVSLLNAPQAINSQSRLPQFKKWRDKVVPSFTFGDVHMLIRRSSLAYIGLYNTSFVMMDWEYSLRISYLKANIAYYTGYNALNVAHPQTVTSLANVKLITTQGKRIGGFYEYPGDRADISLYSEIKIWLGKTYARLKQSKALSPNYAPPSETELEKIYRNYYEKLEQANKSGERLFIN
jgi:glycosyltransferase involved in cell wall biosynthesis